MKPDEVIPEDKDLLALLKSRDGSPTLISMLDGKRYTVYNIAWGYDVGDAYAHITTNISPEVPGASIDFFFTDQVLDVREPSSETILYTSK